MGQVVADNFNHGFTQIDTDEGKTFRGRARFFRGRMAMAGQAVRAEPFRSD